MSEAGEAAVPEIAGAQIVADGPPPCSGAIVVMVTPADLQQHGRRLERLDAPTFFRRLIRRIGTLVESYCSTPPDAATVKHSALAVLAVQGIVKEQQVSVQNWERESSPNDAKHPLTGLIGQALLTNIPEPPWSYLVLGQWAHLYSQNPSAPAKNPGSFMQLFRAVRRSFR